MSHLLIIITGMLTAVCCSLLGTFLILRRMAMLGDAISHAVLPGLVIAFLLSGTRSSFPMLIGASVVGLLTTVIIEFLSSKSRLQADASIGITFTFLFAVGIILVSSLSGQIDLDQDCVLYGEIAYVPLDNLTLFGTVLGPRGIWVTGLNLLIVFGFISIGYKGLQITTFNRDFATAIGINVAAWQYSLMGAVSLTTVLNFELVGAILVVAFLIVPPATAYLVSTELKKMLMWSVV
ncbi:MAG: metal ABC transporter permease, partial [Bacteroidota bacterium]